MKELSVSCCVYRHPVEEVLECTLHGFGDASNKAYCVVIYFVYRTSLGVYAILLTSKARVAPLKAMSIPRWELMSACLLAQLRSLVTAAFENQLELSPPKFWLDSMTALYWIQNRSKWKQFVQHRVNEILKLTNKVDWGHCPGIENLADIGSRGELASQLKGDKLWSVGPDWLCRPREEWPKFESIEKGKGVLEEERKCAAMLVQVGEPASIGVVVDVS